MPLCGNNILLRTITLIGISEKGYPEGRFSERVTGHYHHDKEMGSYQRDTEKPLLNTDMILSDNRKIKLKEY